MPRLIWVEWRDSTFLAGWHPAPADETIISTIETVGYLIHEDQQQIEVAHSGMVGRGEFGGILAIPKSAIVQRKTIRLWLSMVFSEWYLQPFLFNSAGGQLCGPLLGNEVSR